jgi:hypothetical protein
MVNSIMDVTTGLPAHTGPMGITLISDYQSSANRTYRDTDLFLVIRDARGYFADFLQWHPEPAELDIHDVRAGRPVVLAIVHIADVV